MLGLRRELEESDIGRSKNPEYYFKTEFQSHEPEVNYKCVWLRGFET